MIESWWDRESLEHVGGPLQPDTGSTLVVPSFRLRVRAHPLDEIHGADFVSQSQRGRFVHIVSMRLRVDVGQVGCMGGLFT